MDSFKKLLHKADNAHAKCIRELRDNLERKRNDSENMLSPFWKFDLPPYGYIPNTHLTLADETQLSEKPRLWRERESLQNEVAGGDRMDDAPGAEFVGLDDGLRTLVNYTYGPLHTQLLDDLDLTTRGRV
ncbi:unnamed protein product [Clonostachys rosea f. rosea IK726]|uniref:Uncharacterized protein n=1 Tax=Clonostachys rosea f. rosea IK726 TaxID=1349383 RepID=A0ACA9TC03_BIOOC|nr:unnamed protein product [Clonostachys rosea f. rosea IK726]